MPATRFLAALVLAASLSVSLSAQGTVPTFRDVSTHAFGERITVHHEMQAYLERLAATSPRVTLIRQGFSWERRALLLAVVTAPENHARLAEIRENSLRLADPRKTTPEQARAIIANQPVIVWFGGSIHGFELSGSEGVLKLLEHLTTRNDAATLEVLRNTVILIDPMLNPDGRDAFASINHMNIGREPNPAPMDWNNDFTGWQAIKFRTGHYFFDNNRDWFAQTQREQRDRAPTLHSWRPQVATDMHEMGADAEFYFDPPGDPTNPHFPAFALRWFKEFGNAYAAAFDSAGFEYMTRERYNYFYAGYTSVRGYHGGVSMLFEQGSTRGLALERREGPVRTLAQALEQQYVAAWTGARTSAARREMILREYYESQRAAVAPSEGPRRFFIANDGSGNSRELVRMLRRNDIEVGTLTGELRLPAARDRAGVAGARTLGAGSFVVEVAQPSGRLVRALLDPNIPVPAAFLAQARAYTDRNENPRFYDVTAWSLPLLFDVAAYSSDAPAAPATRAVTDADLAARPVPDASGAYAYILPGTQPASVAALHHLKLKGHRAGVILKATRVGTLDVPTGSVIVRIGQNEATIHRDVADVATRYGIDVSLARTALSDSGLPALGSGDWTFNAKTASIALLGEDPISGLSFGWAWYTLDEQYQIPTTVLRTRSIASTPLDRFNVLVIPEAPSGALVAALGRPGVDRIRRWVQDGGTLVTIGSATEFARDTSALGLIALRSWYQTSDEGRRATQFSAPGAIFRAELDHSFWLRAGYTGAEIPMLVNSSRLYLPPDGPPNSSRRVVARYAAQNSLISGHAWDETKARIGGTVAVYEQIVGLGRVIAFAEDPNFRAFHRGMNRMFLNAVILGPGAP